MRILALTAGFVSEDGPGYVPGLVDLFGRLGGAHDIELHAIVPPPGHTGTLRKHGLEIIGYGRDRREIRMMRLLGRVAAGRPYDVVWCLFPDRTGTAGLAVSRLLQRPLLVSVLSSALADLPDIGHGARRTAIGRMHLNAVFAAAKIVTVGSERLVAQTGVASKTRRAPLGIPPIDARVARPRTGPVRVLAVSNLQRIKQPHLLTWTLAELRRAGIDAQLTIYGHGTPTEKAQLDRDIRRHGLGDRVTHAGFVDNAAMATEYAQYDLLLHTSAAEAQGMALIEAAAAGLPVVCLDVGVAPELARLGAAIEIAPSPGDLARAAARAMDRSDKADSQVILQRFGGEACADRFDRVLREAVS